MFKYFILFLLIFSASILRRDRPHSNQNSFFVWNVGQGLWTTYRSEHFCDHFDMGGEFDLTKKIVEQCHGKTHRLHISHWDWDHMSFVKKFKSKNELCIWSFPSGPASYSKHQILKDLPLCNEKEKTFEIIYKKNNPTDEWLNKVTNSKKNQNKSAMKNSYETVKVGQNSKQSTNDLSEVIRIHNILIPGDSPLSQEKKWSHSSVLKSTQGLILGHHGSKTSTSQELLDQLPNLKWAVASSRKKRFGHPHPEILRRLKKNKTPILKTEDWGSIEFRL